jgi:hypothetical protein
VGQAQQRNASTWHQHSTGLIANDLSETTNSTSVCCTIGSELLFPAEWSHVVHNVGTDAGAEVAVPPIRQPATSISGRSGEVGESGNRRRASPPATALIRWRRDDNTENVANQCMVPNVFPCCCLQATLWCVLTIPVAQSRLFIPDAASQAADATSGMIRTEWEDQHYAYLGQWAQPESIRLYEPRSRRPVPSPTRDAQEPGL